MIDPPPNLLDANKFVDHQQSATILGLPPANKGLSIIVKYLSAPWPFSKGKKGVKPSSDRRPSVTKR